MTKSLSGRKVVLLLETTFFLNWDFFLGVLRQYRSFCLSVTDKTKGKSREVSIPSDLVSMTRLNIALVNDKRKFKQSLQTICNSLIETMKTREKEMHFSLLPSTSLAIGYFNNFVVQVCKKLLQTSSLPLENDEKDRVENGKKDSVDISQGNFEFNIVLPDKGANAGHEGFIRFLNSDFAQKHHLRKVQIEGIEQARRFPFYVDSILKDGHIVLYDYPTTLLGAVEAIQSTKQSGTSTEEIQSMESREIVNFGRTLRLLLDNKP